MDVFLI